jgi:hypothetical protein
MYYQNYTKKKYRNKWPWDLFIFEGDPLVSRLYRKGHPYWSPRLQSQVWYWIVFWSCIILVVEFWIFYIFNSDFRIFWLFEKYYENPWTRNKFLPDDPNEIAPIDVRYEMELYEISIDYRYVFPWFYFLFLPPWCVMLWYYSRVEFWHEEQYDES